MFYIKFYSKYIYIYIYKRDNELAAIEDFINLNQNINFRPLDMAFLRSCRNEFFNKNQIGPVEMNFFNKKFGESRKQ